MADITFRSNNHFVPRLYLKRFSADGSKVWERRLLVPHESYPHWSPVALRKLTARKHLYTQSTSESVNDDLERWFDAEFEAPAEESIRLAVESGRMGRADWKALIRFLALQDLRTPAHYLKSMKHWSEQLPSLLGDFDRRLAEAAPGGISLDDLHKIEVGYAEMGIPLRIEPIGTAQEGKITLTIHASIGRKTWLSDIKHALSDSAPLRQLMGHHWTILEAARGQRFVTSDTPVTKCNLLPNGRYGLGGGWNQRGSLIFMALDPTHLLFAEVGAKPCRWRAVLSREETLFVRDRIVANATRSVLGLEADIEVTTMRKRRVNLEQFRNEEREWANWAIHHLEAERIASERVCSMHDRPE
jgi:hypothetical protein